jgi:acyl-CoA reductase-like NAD-dependent aldehyde dehydrogenase
MTDTTTTNLLTIPLLINGQEILTPTTFPITSPYTNTPCWTSSSATPAHALQAVSAASAAFPTWSTTKPTFRRDILLKAADLLEERLEENAGYMRTEMGADEGASAGFVVPLAIRMLRDVAGRIGGICGSVPVVEAEGQSAIVYKEAMGVILGIVPWYVSEQQSRGVELIEAYWAHRDRLL